MKRLFYLLFVIPFILNSQNQKTWETCTKEELVEAWKKTCNWLSSTNSYSFAMKYTSFKDHSTKEISESSTGYYKRFNNSFKSYMNNVLSVQNEKMRIVVDSTNKEIYMLDAGSLIANTMETSELVKLLENVTGIKKLTTEKSVMYHLDFGRKKYLESYEFKITNGQILTQLVYYYGQRVEQEYPETGGIPVKETKIKPRLQIDFSEYKYPISVNDNFFAETNYVTPVNGKYKPVPKYSSYTLSDSRYKNNK